MKEEVQNIDNEEVKRLLSEAGLKVTPQRMAIYRTVYDRKDHPTADKVHEAIATALPTISLGTVYKTLDTLVTKGLLSRVATDEGLLRYDANPVQHLHLYLTDSGEIIDLHDEELMEMIRQHLESKKIRNFEVQDIRLQITGRKQNPHKGIDHE
ncbi:Fur family transcriptional regulator [Roseivirga sp. BDSF3-8]|uniref:Fur family transcriptional regulator n=1 Tax=Roseivirga sp. BDSF3-8 TaxID=3241598 RepID=UPI003531C05C